MSDVQAFTERMQVSPEIFVRWSDDGVVLVCERVACMVLHESGTSAPPLPGDWTSETFPYNATPEMLVEARNAHQDTHAVPEPATKSAEEFCFCGAYRNAVEDDPHRGCSANVWHDPNAGRL